jgi:integrase
MTRVGRWPDDLAYIQRKNTYLMSAAIASTSKAMVSKLAPPMIQPIPLPIVSYIMTFSFHSAAVWAVSVSGGKRHEMPAHHNLEAYLDAYIEAAGIRDGGKTPLFRSAIGRTGTLTTKAMNRVDAWRMIQRRAADLGTRSRIGCHTFRATGITAYLEAGGTLENAQAMAAHESPRTTKLYDRTDDAITLDEVERITI